MAQLSLRVDNELRDLSQALEKIVCDQERILESIEKDSNLALRDNESKVLHQQVTDVPRLLAHDAGLSKQLGTYQGLSVISDLLDEFSVNFQLWELENCFHSLHNVHRRLQNLDSGTLPLQFQESLKLHVNTLHLDLLTRCEEVMQQMWTIESDSITFNISIKAGPDQTVIEYLPIREFLDTCLFPDGRFETTFWFVSSLGVTDIKDTVITKLSKLYGLYIGLQEIQGQLKSFLFATGAYLETQDNCSLRKIPRHCNAGETIRSFEAIVSFLSEIIWRGDANTILARLGSTLVVEIIKFSKQNSRQVLGSDTGYKEQILNLNNQLKVMSVNSNGVWPYDGRELDSILHDDSVIINLMLDKLLQRQLVKIRNLFKDSNWRRTTMVQKSVPKTSTEAKSVISKRTTSQGSDDGWGWDNDDPLLESGDEEEGTAWDNEIEIETEDGKQPKTSQPDAVEKSQFSKQDEWQNDWDEATGFDEVFTDGILITTLPSFGLQMLKEFDAGCQDITKTRVEAVIDYKLNVLLTSFMAMCICKCDDWCQLYHDVEHIVAEYPDKQRVYRLEELNSHFVDTHVNNMKKTVKGLVDRQFKSFLTNENNPNWGITIESLLPYIETVALPAILKLQNIILLKEFVAFTYVDCFIQEVMTWRVISEKNSENLAKMIKLLLASTQQPRLDSDAGCKQLREKLGTIGQVLTAHLTDLMDMFSNGDFYLFTTDEIVRWIILLFADTGLRRECINEIKSIRAERDS
ncbi:LADA_0H02674g1_1 [Lachancea dasiensis]|uniref:LADA_0H02674g1_1 n=1 Tax=Lachancea dasiensis TaxID=1072105 RepID=A0A1G4JZV3_9SACH|nr:LADA_0H02674g1_1 [Lachancea dasiensis]